MEMEPMEELELYQDWCHDVVQCLGVQMRDAYRFTHDNGPQHGETSARFLKRLVFEEPIIAYTKGVMPADYAAHIIERGLGHHTVAPVAQGEA